MTAITSLTLSLSRHQEQGNQPNHFKGKETTRPPTLFSPHNKAPTSVSGNDCLLWVMCYYESSTTRTTGLRLLVIYSKPVNTLFCLRYNNGSVRRKQLFQSHSIWPSLLLQVVRRLLGQFILEHAGLSQKLIGEHLVCLGRINGNVLLPELNCYKTQWLSHSLDGSSIERGT